MLIQRKIHQSPGRKTQQSKCAETLTGSTEVIKKEKTGKGPCKSRVQVRGLLDLKNSRLSSQVLLGVPLWDSAAIVGRLSVAFFDKSCGTTEMRVLSSCAPPWSRRENRERRNGWRAAEDMLDTDAMYRRHLHFCKLVRDWGWDRWRDEHVWVGGGKILVTELRFASLDKINDYDWILNPSPSSFSPTSRPTNQI